MEYYDMHCHLSEFSDSEIDGILNSLKGLTVVAVSEDLASFRRTLDLAQSYGRRVVPCAGFHPWSLRNHSIDEAWELLAEAQRAGVTCIGEVGLDLKFMDRSTLEPQLKVFRAYARLAAELRAFLNVHSPEAWDLALAEASSLGVEKVMFHWYTGPLNLIGPITSRGYFISINAALKVQRKSVAVATAVPLDNMVFETDGPYNYHGLRLVPLMLPELSAQVASLRGLSVNELMERVNTNSRRLLGMG